jgi:hypothetical protein
VLRSQQNESPSIEAWQSILADCVLRWFHHQQTSHEVVEPKPGKRSLDHPYCHGVDIITEANRQQLTQQSELWTPCMQPLLKSCLRERTYLFKSPTVTSTSPGKTENDEWLDVPVLTAMNWENFAFTHSLAKAQSFQCNTVVVYLCSALG